MKSKPPKSKEHLKIAGLSMDEHEEIFENAKKRYFDELAGLVDEPGKPIKSTIVKSSVPSLEIVEGEPVGVLIKVDFKARKRLS